MCMVVEALKRAGYFFCTLLVKQVRCSSVVQLLAALQKGSAFAWLLG